MDYRSGASTTKTKNNEILRIGFCVGLGRGGIESNLYYHNIEHVLCFFAVFSQQWSGNLETSPLLKHLFLDGQLDGTITTSIFNWIEFLIL